MIYFPSMVCSQEKGRTYMLHLFWMPVVVSPKELCSCLKHMMLSDYRLWAYTIKTSTRQLHHWATEVSIVGEWLVPFEFQEFSTWSWTWLRLNLPQDWKLLKSRRRQIPGHQAPSSAGWNVYIRFFLPRNWTCLALPLTPTPWVVKLA